ncbi:uncharacterized protein LOC119375318 [Rhipicephalus sanguineus]|uniref:uncharacterized protein LOC119375318 n=1 Tax=Rhipicephalus sanguineus TaxID=34632 RepID=UPI001895A522|nr:uncharacterized protein LOC119375318 [Rhipicephalus sanguineus]
MTATAPPPAIVMHQPKEPPIFRGLSREDPETWLESYERTAALNDWDISDKSRYVYFALQDRSVLFHYYVTVAANISLPTTTSVRTNSSRYCCASLVLKSWRDATPTIFSQQRLQTSECNDSAHSSCGLNRLLTAAAVVDEAKGTHCPSAANVLLTPAAVDGYEANTDATQARLGSSQGHTATDSAPSYFPEDAPSSSECDALPACSTACSAGVETTHEPSCQPIQALTVPVESQQNFCAACGELLSAEGTADVTGSSSSSWDADQAVVAALHKRIATLKECLNNMKRKVATLQQQKSRANRRNHELTRNIKKYLSPDQLQGMRTSSMREKQWSTETIQKGLKLRLACGSRGYNAVRELAVPLPSERTLQRRVENYMF